MAGNSSRSIPRSSSAPARKGKASAAARKAAKPSILGRVIARPGVIVAGATFAAVMTGIVANAVMFQKGHHPAPLFGTVAGQAGTREALAPAAVPLPVPVQREVAPAPAAPEAAADETPAQAAPAAPAVPAATHLSVVRKVTKPAKHAEAAQHKAPLALHKLALAARASHTDSIKQLLDRD